MKKRCFGFKELYVRYHDEEWGVPVHDDQHLFEMLILEGAQAGLIVENCSPSSLDSYAETVFDFAIFVYVKTSKLACLGEAL